MNKTNPSSTNNGFPPSEAQNSAATPTAVIGPKIRLKGELVGEEDLIIQGEVDGIIDLRENHLTVGAQGSVKANVVAKTVTIEGNVEGDVFGQERIAILSSSNVNGNIVAARVMLEDGAKFRGSIDMDIEAHQKELEARTKTSVAPATPRPNSKNVEGNVSADASKGSETE